MSSDMVKVDVVLNDSLESVDFDQFDKIVLSPGPGLPNESGALMNLISDQIGKKPILGVCLGMQALAQELNGGLYNQSVVKHGVGEIVSVEDSDLFTTLDREIQVGLYHSWAIDGSGDYRVTAKSKNGVIMAIENLEKQIYGVQFHPESILTPFGKVIIENFLNL